MAPLKSHQWSNQYYLIVIMFRCIKNLSVTVSYQICGEGEDHTHPGPQVADLELEVFCKY